MKKEIIWLSPPDVGASENVMNTWCRYVQKEGWKCNSTNPSFIFAGSDSQLEKAFALSNQFNVPGVVCYFWGYPPQRLLDPGFREFVIRKLSLLSRCFSILCPTELVANQLADFGIPANICQPGAKLPLVNTNPTKKKSIDIISIGRLEPLKGFADLITAAHQSRSVTIIGEGSLKDSLRKLAKETGVDLILLKGINDREKFRLLGKANLFVCPSYYEGFGLPVLEALLTGLPVIARRLPIYTLLYGGHVQFFDTNQELTLAIDHPITLPALLPQDHFSIARAAADLSTLFGIFVNRLEKLKLGEAIRKNPSPQEIKEIYEEDARLNWDYSAHRFNPHWHRHWRVEHALRALKGKNILDLGCSYGAYAIRFAELGYNVTGVDFSKTYLDKAKELANEYKVKINFIEADFTNRLPFSDRSFDSIWAGEVFEHLSLENLSHLLEEISRLLTLDGVLIFSSPLGEHHDDPLHLQHWDSKEFCNLLEKLFKKVSLSFVHLEEISELPGQEPSTIFALARKTH